MAPKTPKDPKAALTVELLDVEVKASCRLPGLYCDADATSGPHLVRVGSCQAKGFKALLRINLMGVIFSNRAEYIKLISIHLPRQCVMRYNRSILDFFGTQQMLSEISLCYNIANIAAHIVERM